MIQQSLTAQGLRKKNTYLKEYKTLKSLSKNRVMEIIVFLAAVEVDLFLRGR